MEAVFNVTGERRKALVETVKAFVLTGHGGISFCRIRPVDSRFEPMSSATTPSARPANEALMAALNAKGFIAE